MRKFSLYINGTKYNLNGEGGVWFTDPEGLGADFSPAVVNLRNGFFNRAAIDNIPQHTINGTLVFKPMPSPTPGTWFSAYDTYTAFCSMLTTSAVYEFGYTPDTILAPAEYRVRVAFDFISKGDGNGNWIYCPVGFTVLSPWYKTTTVALPLAVDEDDVNVFVADYNVVASAGAAFVLTAESAGTPSAISVVNADTDELYGIFSLANGEELNAGGVLEFSNLPDNCYAKYTYDAAGVTHVVDLVNKANLSDADMFGRMAPNVKNRIIVLYTAGVSKPTSVSATIYNYWWSV